MILDARASVAAAADVAALIGPELGWTAADERHQVSAFVEAARADLDAAGLGTPATLPGLR